MFPTHILKHLSFNHPEYFSGIEIPFLPNEERQWKDTDVSMQSDANEFLTKLIVAVDSTTSKGEVNPREWNPYHGCHQGFKQKMGDFFRMEEEIEYSCGHEDCGHTWVKGDTVLSNEVSMLNDLSTIQELRTKCRAKQRLDGCICQECEKRDKTFKETRIINSPLIYRCYVNRASYDKQSGMLQKNHMPIDPASVVTINGDHYNIRGFTIHDGEVGGGHYLSTIRRDNKFIHIDDDDRKQNHFQRDIYRGNLFLYELEDEDDHVSNNPTQDFILEQQKIQRKKTDDTLKRARNKELN